MRYDQYYKSRVPGTHAFPVSLTEIEAALEAAGVEHLHAVSRRWVQAPDVALSVNFHGEAVSPYSDRIWLAVYAVPRARRVEAAALLREVGLPRACAWVRKAERAQNVWRATNHRLWVTYGASGLSFEET